MYELDFRDYDGNFAHVMREIADWFEEQKPKNATMTVISQESDFIHIRFHYS